MLTSDDFASAPTLQLAIGGNRTGFAVTENFICITPFTCNCGVNSDLYNDFYSPYKSYYR